MSRKKKLFAVATAVSMLAILGVGGTMAYLFDSTSAIANNFELGSIANGENFSLTETTGSTYTIVPGVDITKDPVVTADATNETEDAYVFVAVYTNSCWSKSADHMTYTAELGEVEDALSTSISSDWTYLCDDTTTGTASVKVYYAEVAAGTLFEKHVLQDDKITVSTEFTIADLDDVDITQYTLGFKSYTIQKAGFATVQAAYDEAKSYKTV